jgi:hypothetical protein
MNTALLIVLAFVLFLILGMQIQVSNMCKKIDELIGTRPKK